MDFNDYFEPVDVSKLDLSIHERQDKNLYSQVNKEFSSFNLEDLDLAIFGVCEERNSRNKGTAGAPDKIRQQFYRLCKSERAGIIDFGNLKPGKSLKDTYTAVSEVTSEFLSNKVIPVVLGGSQDIMYALYLAYDKLNLPIKLAAIDPKLDLGYKKDDFDSDSYLGQIILEKGKNLFNFSNIGYQSYFCNKDELQLLNKLNFDAFRLGYVRSNLSDIEPVLRDANILGIDVSAIKQSDSPGHKFPSPNGLYSEEICQLARYAGISDNLSIFGIFDMNPVFDVNEQSARLAAQIIWHFIDGFNSRQKDFPLTDSQNYTKHIVSFEKSDQNIVFYQNNFNKRWWMEVPYPKNPQKNMTIACTYNDYKMSCNQELPERWLKTIQKLN
ncbi:MAG: formimidoylglutamase [Bacteroidales bacterium]